MSIIAHHAPQPAQSFFCTRVARLWRQVCHYSSVINK